MNTTLNLVLTPVAPKGQALAAWLERYAVRFPGESRIAITRPVTWWAACPCVDLGLTGEPHMVYSAVGRAEFLRALEAAMGSAIAEHGPEAALPLAAPEAAREAAIAKAAEKAAESAAYTDRLRREAQSYLAAGPEPSWLYAYGAQSDIEERLGDVMAALKAEYARRKAAREAAEKADAEAKAAAEAAGRELLRAWALAHGSDLLRARLEEGMSWRKLAREEFARAVCRDLGDKWSIDGGVSRRETERSNATIEEIAALREARATVVSRELPVADLQLVWCELEDEDTGEDLAWTVLVGTVRCPDGEEVRIGRVL